MFQKLNEKQTQKYINHLNSRYGIEKEWLQQFIWLKNNKYIWMATKQCEKYNAINYNPKAIGLLIFVNDKEFTPALKAMTFFNKRITKNIVEVDEEQAKQLLTGQSINLKDTQKNNILSEGYIAIKLNQNIIGSANFYKQVLKANLPK